MHFDEELTKFRFWEEKTKIFRPAKNWSLKQHNTQKKNAGFWHDDRLMKSSSILSIGRCPVHWKYAVWMLHLPHRNWLNCIKGRADGYIVPCELDQLQYIHETVSVNSICALQETATHVICMQGHTYTLQSNMANWFRSA